MIGLRPSISRQRAEMVTPHKSTTTPSSFFCGCLFKPWQILKIGLKVEELIPWNVYKLYERNFKYTYQFPLLSQFLGHNDCEILPKMDQFEKNKNNSIKYTIKLRNMLWLRFIMFFYSAFMISLPNKYLNISKQNPCRRWGKFPEEELC